MLTYLVNRIHSIDGLTNKQPTENVDISEELKSIIKTEIVTENIR